MIDKTMGVVADSLIPGVLRCRWLVVSTEENGRCDFDTVCGYGSDLVYTLTLAAAIMETSGTLDVSKANLLQRLGHLPLNHDSWRKSTRRFMSIHEQKSSICHPPV